MNRFKTLILCSVSLFLWTSLMAQAPNNGKDFVGAKVLFIDYGIPNNVDGTSITNGLEVLYKRNINQFLSVGIPAKAGFINTPNAINNQNFFSIDATVRGQYYRPEALLNPYVFAGFGFISETKTTLTTGGETGSSYTQIPAGIGVDIGIGNNSFVNIQAEYRTSMEPLRDNLQVGVGLNFRLGKTIVNDNDKDGVPNELDDCPQLSGSAALKGCPDTDGDGIGDNVDECPDAAGTAANNGCPDSDGDGVPDKDDLCPTTSGSLNGCPDTDGDGVSDKDDQCPTTSGSSALNGCPDSDNDGVRDQDDNCPNEAGTLANKGCPEIQDTDGDGVPDEDDLCPNQSGPLNGCPDSDNDGVRDQDDNCPYLAGILENNGCPQEEAKEEAQEEETEPESAVAPPLDSDQDGVIDSEDACPDKAGTVANKGCPEIKQADKKILDIAMREVRFKTSNAILLEESKQILDQIGGIMERYPEFSLKISGHTDSIGDDESNQYLSEERAKACYAHLVAYGINPTRLSHIGYGENMPLTNNKSRADRQRNRRVEFVLFIK